MHHLRSVKPPHVQPPFNGCFLSSSARRRPIFLILNWKCKTISKSIQTTDQNCPLCNFLKDPADKLYLIAILRDFFQLRKLKRILLSSAEKCSKSIFFQRCTGIEDVSAVQSIFNFYQIGSYRLKVCNQFTRNQYSHKFQSLGQKYPACRLLFTCVQEEIRKYNLYEGWMWIK